MLWAYFSFSQYLIIWSGNLPEEIAWYLHRLQTGWRFVALALVVFHFAVPFLLLLSRAVKRSAAHAGQGRARASCVARLIDLFWLIAPEFHRDGISVSWMDVVLPLTLVSIWLGCFIWQLRGRAILPVTIRSSKKRSDRSSSGRRAARRRHTSHGHGDARSRRRRITSRRHHEESDVNIRGDLRLRRGLIVVGVVVHARRVAAVPLLRRAARRSAAAPRVSARGRPGRSAAARAAAADRLRGRTCSDLRDAEDEMLERLRLGGSRTPAWCGFRSTRR